MKNKRCTGKLANCSYQILEQRRLLAGIDSFIEAASVDLNGDPVGGFNPSISETGRYVAFNSGASDLVPNDNNGLSDIFVRDMELGTTQLVSVAMSGQESDGNSHYPMISRDGRFVGFISRAENLVANDSNGSTDIFVRDLLMGTTIMVPADLQTTAISPAHRPSLSDDGRFIAFVSEADDLVAADNNGVQDAFVYDSMLDTVTRVSTSVSGIEGDRIASHPSISADGNYIAFESSASNLIDGADGGDRDDIYLKDLNSGSVTLVSQTVTGGFSGFSTDPRLSADGRYVVYRSLNSSQIANDSNQKADIFVRDLANGTTVRASESVDGIGGNQHAYQPAISDDGRFVTFRSHAWNLEDGSHSSEQDIFLKDLDNGDIIRISKTSSLNPPDFDSYAPEISGDGKFVAFYSKQGFVDGAANGQWDTFRSLISNKPTISVEAGDSDSETLFATGPNLSVSGTLTVEDIDLTDSVSVTAVHANNNGEAYGIDDATFENMFSIANANVIDETTTTGTIQWSFDSGSEAFDHLVEGEPLEIVYFLRATDHHGAENWLNVKVTVIGTREFTPQLTRLVSTDSDGDQGNDFTLFSSISGDGRFVSFVSDSDNLIDGDTNGERDAFVKDIWLGTTTRISEQANGTGGNAYSWTTDISANGRYIAFGSSATNLLSFADNNNQQDVFLYDRELGTTTLVSQNLSGGYGNGYSAFPSISDDGRYVAFESQATDLVPDDTGTTNYRDIFVRDMVAGTTTKVSTNAAGQNAGDNSYEPSISGDGVFVAFESEARNLGDDTNDDYDIFVKNTITGEVNWASPNVDGTTSDGNSVEPTISGDGRYVVFGSSSTDLVANDNNSRTDVFLRDLVAGTTVRVSQDGGGEGGNNSSESPAISYDGRYVAFESLANNLTDYDFGISRDILVKDMSSDSILRYTADWTTGRTSNNRSDRPSFSADGRFLVFDSAATNLVEGDTNQEYDIFRSSIEFETTIDARHVFYANSQFGSSNAVDKSPLLPGQTATFENYTSYIHGINGIAIDVDSSARLDLGPADFEFRFGNNNLVSSWSVVDPADATFDVVENGGRDGMGRIEITFDDGWLTNGWLQVKVLASDNTGLVADDVFYFGNAIAETGNSATDAFVNLVDVGATRGNQTGFVGAQIDNRYDFNRDGRVNLVDVGISRVNQTGFSSLQLITPPISDNSSSGRSSSSDSDESKSGFENLRSNSLLFDSKFSSSLFAERQKAQPLYSGNRQDVKNVVEKEELMGIRSEFAEEDFATTFDDHIDSFEKVNSRIAMGTDFSSQLGLDSLVAQFDFDFF